MSKKCMFKHMDDFSILNLLGANTRPSKVCSFASVLGLPYCGLD